VITAFDGPVQATAASIPDVRKTRTRIGMIFQQFNMVGRLSLFSNVAWAHWAGSRSGAACSASWPAGDQAVGDGGPAPLRARGIRRQRANTLSGGQQQRGAIARALVQKAKIILADEPVASLDPVSARRVMEILRDLNKQDGLTVLVTLHQVDYALRYCDRVVALKAGKIVYDGPPAA
jgi:phosphonate transport system ATP-binding protein